MFITNGTVCDFMVVQAITKPEEKKHNSFSMIIVDANAKGITRNKIKGRKMGIRASDTAEIAFEDVRVPQSNCWARRAAGSTSSCTSSTTTRSHDRGQAWACPVACLEASVSTARSARPSGRRWAPTSSPEESSPRWPSRSRRCAR
jgi:alkylation response protein AidB-like acyl-CoA dehydrogenase